MPATSELNKIDHLIYTAPTLDVGRDAIESILGVRPIIGGQHPNYGTHNALLSLGDFTYLEILSPDPSLSVPNRGRWMETSSQGLGLATWVLRAENIEMLQEQAIRQGIELGAVETGKRAKPDGTLLSWKLTDPYALPLAGALPFLINWGKSQHPATTALKAGELVGFEIGHPQPELVARSLASLGIQLDTFESDQVKLIARIQTERGMVILN